MITFYILTVICNLHELSTIALCTSIAGMVFSGIIAIGFADEYSDKNIYDAAKKFCRYCIYILFVSSAFSVFIPSKTDMVAIVGGGSVYEYVKSNKDAQKIPDNVVKKLNKWLEE